MLPWWCLLAFLRTKYMFLKLISFILNSKLCTHWYKKDEKKLEFMNIKKWFFCSSGLRGWMFFLLFSSFSQHQNNILGFCFFLGHWQKYQQFFFMVKKTKQIQSLIFVTHCGYKQPVMQHSYTVLSSENTGCLIQLTSSPLILISIMIWLSHD